MTDLRGMALIASVFVLLMGGCRRQPPEPAPSLDPMLGACIVKCAPFMPELVQRVCYCHAEAISPDLLPPDGLGG